MLLPPMLELHKDVLRLLTSRYLSFIKIRSDMEVLHTHSHLLHTHRHPSHPHSHAYLLIPGHFLTHPHPHSHHTHTLLTLTSSQEQRAGGGVRKHDFHRTQFTHPTWCKKCGIHTHTLSCTLTRTHTHAHAHTYTFSHTHILLVSFLTFLFFLHFLSLYYLSLPPPHLSLRHLHMGSGVARV